MTKAPQWLMVAGAATLALCLGLWLGLRQAQTNAEPTALPSFTLNDLHGEARSPDEFAGQLLLINFWATWCLPCLDEIPLLIDAQEEYGPAGLQILGPALDDSAAVASMAGEMGINYPVLVADQPMFDLMDAMGDTLGALPFTVLADRQGNIVERHWGALDTDRIEAWMGEHLH